jgi:hypothetical protein
VAKIGKNWLKVATIDRFSNFFRLFSRFLGRGTHARQLLFALYCFCVWAVLPSFYLMGDVKFRADFDQHGFRRAFWQRLRNFNVFKSKILYNTDNNNCN